MPKNLISNHFDKAGIYVEGQRSVFPFKKPVTASFCSGMLVPLGDPIPVFPGTKLDLTIDAAIRSNTMVVPPLDGMYIDFFAVWVPHRIVWTHFPQFLGEPESVAWTQTSTYVYPFEYAYLLNNRWASITATDKSVTFGNFSLFDHYGLLRGSAMSTGQPIYDKHINMLAARGYYSLWNFLFRDENYQRPVLFSKGDNGSSGEFGYLLRHYTINVDASNNPIYLENSSTGLNVTFGASHNSSQAVLMPVNKLHDAFTSLLPQAQFGNEVTIPLGSTAPVSFTGDGAIVVKDDSVDDWTNYTALLTKTALSSGGYTDVQVQRSGGTGSMAADSPLTFVGTGTANLANAAAASINQFRYSVMYQRYLEALARGGRRMPEYMHTIYGVKNTNAKCDYPELISRSRYVLGVNQVVATADSSGSGWTSHLGDTGAYSLTALRNIPVCEKDYTEFGYLHILYCVRSDNRYSSFVQEHFLRSDLLSEYNPFFDHIGDVTVPSYMVNMFASVNTNFGFQEAWWSERTQLAMSTGALNKRYGSLSYWILGENLGDTYTCTPGYLTFDPAVLDDIFVSKYYTYPQFIIDAVIKGKKFARMSQHSIPGIVGRI